MGDVLILENVIPDCPTNLTMLSYFLMSIWSLKIKWYHTKSLRYSCWLV